VPRISKGISGVGVLVSTNTAGPQETKNNRIRLAGKNRKILGNVFFITPYLLGDRYMDFDLQQVYQTWNLTAAFQPHNLHPPIRMVLFEEKKGGS
jgi:hypothetical protein